MKILYVVKGIGVNGITKVMFTYYDYLDRQKYHIDFVSGDDYIKEYKKKVESDGNLFFIVKNRDKNIINYIKKLSRIIKNGKYDIVHIHGNSTMIFPELMAAKMGGCNVRIAHSHNSFSSHPKLVRLCRPLFDLLYTHGLACSIEAGKWMFKNKQFYVINNGIEVEKFRFNIIHRKQWRNRLGIQDDELLLGNVAAMTYVKNHKFMMDILAELKKQKRKVKLVFVGEGELLEENKEYAYKNNLSENIIFLGAVDCVQDILNAMDIFLFPSFFEGYAIVLMEAQASGLPCYVSSNIPRTTNINDKFKILSIDNIIPWIEALNDYEVLDRMEESNNNINGIRKNKHDVNSCIEELKTFYSMAVKS